MINFPCKLLFLFKKAFFSKKPLATPQGGWYISATDREDANTALNGRSKDR